MSSATSAYESIQAQLTPARTITLLDLVSELVDAGGSDREPAGRETSEFRAEYAPSSTRPAVG